MTLLLLVDNRDSFTFNLYQYLLELGEEVEVCRASDLDLGTVLAMEPSGVVTGPGPGHPKDAHLSQELALSLPASIPLLGVCLGHQAMALAFGGEVERLKVPCHGRSSRLIHRGGSLFHGLPSEFAVGRYHSLTVRVETLPACWHVDALSEDGVLQAMHHHTRPLFGVQFHPESILSAHGHRLLRNFVRITRMGETDQYTCEGV